jgi:hypothetical protein
MALPTPFTTASPTITSFSYTDILSGTSFLTIYGYVSNTSLENSDAVIKTLLLSQNVRYSTEAENEKAGTNIPGDTYEVLDGALWTFTLSPSNSLRVLEGEAKIQNSYAGKASAGNMGLKLKYILKKNGVELASAFTESLDGVAAIYEPTYTRMVTIPLTIPKTILKSTDTLTLVIQGWGRQHIPGTDRLGSFIIGTDPRNTDGEFIKPSEDDEFTTQLKVELPFRID